MLAVLPVFSLQLTHAQVALPYDTDFSFSEGYLSNSSVSGDWLASDPSVVITAAQAHSDTQSVLIPSATPGHLLSLDFDPEANSVVFVNYYTKLTASDPQALPLLTTPETSFAFGLSAEGSELGEWLLLNGDESGAGHWQPAGNYIDLDQSGMSDWQQITLRLDLASSLWDFSVNGDLVAANLGFAEAMTVSSEALLLYGNTLGASYIDTFSLQASHPLFVDADHDGMEDGYELANGLDPTLDDRDLDPDGDGLLNIEEFLLGFDPQDGADALSDDDNDGYTALFEIENGSNPFVLSGPISGYVLKEEWTGIFGTDISQLTSNVNYPDNPNSAELIDSLSVPQDTGSSYGRRLRGYIVPPVSGAYRFWIAADDEGEFHLSTDHLASNLVQVADTNGNSTNYQQWNKYASQQSSAINLVAGEKYYFEILQSEFWLSDHLSVAWTKPDSTFEPIPSSAIATIVPNNSDLDKIPDSYEFAIIDADSGDAFESLEDILADDDFDGDGLSNGQEYHIGTSSVSTDTDGDGLSDFLEHSRGGYDPFDALDGFSDYDEDGYPAGIEGALGIDPDVFDSSVPGYAVVEEWIDVGGTTVDDLRSHSDFPGSPHAYAVTEALDLAENVGDNFGKRIRGYFLPDQTGNYTFQIASNDNGELWVSSDDRPGNAALVASVPGSTSYQQWTKYPEQTSAQIVLVAGQAYYFEVYLKEGTSSDNLSVRWQKPDSSHALIGSADLATFAPGDIDRDLIPDALEIIAVDADPNDGLENVWDLLPGGDYDGDGLTNLFELQLGLSLLDQDTDGDGMPDGFEQAIVDFDLLDAFASHADVLPHADFDGDTVTNYQEYLLGSDPTDPDTNDDGRNDDFEWGVVSADPFDAVETFADVQGLLADHDADGDGLTDLYEYAAGLSIALKDTDGDGLEDGWEVNEGYSATTNEGQSGAFGDLESDHLANRTENVIGSSATTVDTSASLLTTGTISNGDVAIILIGRGTFSVDENLGASSLSQ